jgi:FtsP/CotA-like multicopper oxidase with cupredoxin domain
MNRREFIYFGGSLAAAAFLNACGTSDSNNDGESGADRPGLPVPPLLEGEIRQDGYRHYDLNIHQTAHTFFEGQPTETYAINGTYLGPTLRMLKGDRVSVNYTNTTGETLTMHGHGMRVPGEMDGTAHQPIAPNETWSARYEVLQQACTNWYHPHTLHKTGLHVYKGLAGLIIIDDDNTQAVALPSDYGNDDIPLVLQDRKFNANRSQFIYNPSPMELRRGYVGDTFIVNGAVDPIKFVDNIPIRLRLLNGSNSTMYRLSFSDGRSFFVIASDNGYLETPVNKNEILLSPGERAEIIVDLSNDGITSFDLIERNRNVRFLTFKTNGTGGGTAPLPQSLNTYPSLPDIGTLNVRTFVLNMSGNMNNPVFTINGRTMDPDRIDVALSQGDKEIWRIENPMHLDHNFHIHGIHFRVLKRDGQNVDAIEQGFKDTVFVPGGSTVELYVEIPTDGIAADSRNPYMFHCHFLEHEDNGMMGQFTVT